MNILLLFISFTIVTTTSDITDAVRRLKTSSMEVKSAVPGGMCPGHFDISPEKARILSRSDVIFAHGFETWLDKIKRINPEVEIINLRQDGNWMIPSVYEKGVLEIRNELVKYFPDNPVIIEEIDRNYCTIQAMVDSLNLTINEKKPIFEGRRVLANDYIQSLLDSLGFEVVSTFSPGDEISIREVIEILRKAGKVDAIVDNLQSGGKVGKTIADELGVRHVTISNFPEKNNYKKTFRKNLHKLEQTLID